jgi:SAM-dependent methyltransferase
VSVAYRDPAEFYRDHAVEFDTARSRQLSEKPWLDAFLGLLPRGGTVLDAGCGAGEPIARCVAEAGFRFVGFDASEPLLALARERVPNAEFVHGDLRSFELGRRFDGIIAWDSFFHLKAAEQERALERFARHGTVEAALLFTSGSERGEAINPLFGEPLFHASLDTADYEERLAALGFSVLKHIESDPDCGNRTIWLAKRGEREMHD